MAKPFISMTIPPFERLRGEGEKHAKDLRRASFQATDVAAQKGHRHIQAKIRSVGLKKLANAVAYTSALKKRQDPAQPYGVIYAKGGDDSLAGGALEAYSKGTTIRAKNKRWMAFATAAVPRTMARKRMTPERYRNSGLVTSIGKLVFKLVKPDLALLVVKKVSLSPKTGRARALGKRPPKTRVVPDKDVVAFVLIRQTRRAKRFDQHDIMRIYSGRVPDYIARIMLGRSG